MSERTMVRLSTHKPGQGDRGFLIDYDFKGHEEAIQNLNAFYTKYEEEFNEKVKDVTITQSVIFVKYTTANVTMGIEKKAQRIAELVKELGGVAHVWQADCIFSTEKP